ncbi:MAG: hypothetical protein JSV82_01025 [Planctomycetota bacterium]|nr:MAG: hypothetical protein JSV82_01025 [Planctomycetota bacterium]
MARKAVDVVLLPEKAMANKAIEVNAKLVENFGSEIVLNTENCLPHISLAVGCVDDKDIPAIHKILHSIAKENSLGTLIVSGVQIASVGSRTLSVFEIERTKELQSLHEKVTEMLSPYLTFDVTADMIADAEVERFTLQWISSYKEKSSYQNFAPHITIGYGEVIDRLFPIKFIASKLAFCHLGNHCTCRKILVSVEL